jgi:hypothetical protein
MIIGYRQYYCNKKNKNDSQNKVNKYCDQRVDSQEYLLSHLGISSYREAKGYNRSANTIKVHINKYTFK